MIDGHHLKREAAEIAFPRYPGTPGDQRAIEWLRQRMREIGLKPRVEEFTYDLRPAELAIRVCLLASGLLIAAAGLQVHANPRVGLLLVAVAAAPGLVFLTWSPWLEKIYERDGSTRTANVSCTRPARDPTISFVIVAHHDSKSQSLSLLTRAGLTMLALAGATSLAGAGLIGVVTQPPPTSPRTVTIIGFVACIAFVILATLRSGNASPGGVDNAGSVAILLELARRLPETVEDHIELVFLSTGAEEDHMVGAMRWLRTHAAHFATRPTYCLNLDGAGAPGRVVLIERYGFGTRFSPVLSKAARRAAERLGLEPRGILMLPGVGIDAIPFAHRGIPSLTLASGSLGRATMSVHSPRDRADHLDPEALAAVSDLALEIVRDIASRTGPVR